MLVGWRRLTNTLTWCVLCVQRKVDFHNEAQRSSIPKEKKSTREAGVRQAENMISYYTSKIASAEKELPELENKLTKGEHRESIY